MSSSNNINDGQVTEVAVSCSDDGDAIAATYTDNDGKDVKITAMTKDLNLNSPIISTLSKIITEETAIKSTLLAKDGNDVEFSITGLGTKYWTLTVFIPNASHIPLESEMHFMQDNPGKIQAETEINGERTIFPYITKEDRCTFHEILQKNEVET